MESEPVDALLDDDELFSLITDSIAQSDGELAFCGAISNWCQSHKLQWCGEPDSKMWYDLCLRLKIPVQYQEVVRVLKTRNHSTDVNRLIVAPSDQATADQNLVPMDVEDADSNASNSYKFFTYRGNSFRRILYSHCRDLGTDRSLHKMIEQYCAALREAHSRMDARSAIRDELERLIMQNLDTIQIRFDPFSSYANMRLHISYLQNAMRASCEFDSPRSLQSIVREMLLIEQATVDEQVETSALANVLNPFRTAVPPEEQVSLTLNKSRVLWKIRSKSVKIPCHQLPMATRSAPSDARSRN